MGVDVGGHFDISVSHPFLHVLEGKTLRDEEASAAMTQLVQPDIREAVLPQQLAKLVADEARCVENGKLRWNPMNWE